MDGLMMETPLTLPGLVLPRIERIFASRQIVSYLGSTAHRTTWGEVAERAHRLAGALRELGIGDGDRVATFAWNTHRHLEAYLAVPCMGAVLHTLNVRLFPDQVAYIVEHADDSVVLVDRSLLPAWQKVAEKLSRQRTVIVMPDTDADPGADAAAADGASTGTAAADGNAPANGSAPADALDYEALLAAAAPLDFADVPESSAAAMCYTSGTTGNPKGVVYSHRSSTLHSYGVCAADGVGLGSADTALVVVPMFHANAWGLPLAAAMCGASIVLPGRDLTPPALCRAIEADSCTIAAGVPTIWLGILDHWRRDHPDLSSLRTTLCGGSAVPEALARAFEEEIGVAVLHAWGMTETSPIGSVARVPPERAAGLSDDERRAYLASQGRPVAGVVLRIVAEDGSEAPCDGTSLGEIQARGPWIASAYYRPDEDSADKFADGWLHTGDVGSIDELGFVRIADRTKDLVKSGGEWISTVELEGHLMAHADVQEAAVIAVPDAKWDERPLACVVLRDGAVGRVTPEQLIEHLRPRVARWWLPSGIVFIDEVPKTSVGKFDKKALRIRFPELPADARVTTPEAAASS